MLQNLQKELALKTGEFYLKIPLLGATADAIDMVVSARQLNDLMEIAKVETVDFLHYTLIRDTTYMFSDSDAVYRQGEEREKKINQILEVK